MLNFQMVGHGLAVVAPFQLEQKKPIFILTKNNLKVQ